jgi:hypothetical protein
MTFDLTDQILRTLIASGLQLGVAAVILKAALFTTDRIGTSTFRSMERAFGYRSIIYTTGWIGTPIHEISHLLAAYMFRFRVLEFKPFSPDLESGLLGYVLFESKSDNRINKIGLFVIGIAPLFGGIAVILVLGLLLIPGLDVLIGKIVEASFQRNLVSAHAYLLLIGQASFEGVRLLLDPQNLSRWQFWVFLYLTSCVSSHLSPSKPDVQISREGVTSVVILVIVGNTIAAALWLNPLGYTLYWGAFLGVVLSLLGLTLSISLGVCLTSHIVTLPIRLLRLR